MIAAILEEMEGGCFYNDELLSEAYTEFLLALLDASEDERRDPRIPAFLRAGFEAYLREQGTADPQAALTYRMALTMIGGSARPSSPPPSPLAQPGTPPGSPPAPPQTAKRPRDEEEDGAEESSPTLEVLESRERELKRFKTKFREEVMLVKGLGDALPSEPLMEGLFNTMLDRQKEAVEAKPDDRVILEIQSDENVGNPLWFSMRRTDQLNGRVILDKLSRILNSNENFLINGRFKVSYIHIPVPEGGGRRTNRVANESMEQWVERKISSKTIFSPSNTNDNMCLTRAVAVAMARGCMEKRAFYRMKQENSVIQRREAEKLCESAGLDPQQRCGLDEVQRLQASMPGFRLCVFIDQHGRECVFKGPSTPGCKTVYLLLHQEHFYAILYPCQAFEKVFVCEKCIVFYNHKGEHRCEGICERCFGPALHNNPAIPFKRCPDCHHSFPEGECFSNHQSLKLHNSEFTKCQTFKFCVACEKSYSVQRGQKHLCGFVYCNYCKNNVLENHLCYMSGWNEKEKNPKWNYITIYYDIETTQCDPLDDNETIFEHKPNLLVTHAVCDQCCDIQQNDYFCTVCKNRQHIFHNLDDNSVNVMSQFLDYLQSFTGKTELLIVAHNAKSFDGIFVLQEVIARKLKPELVLQGAKIICMKIGNLLIPSCFCLWLSVHSQSPLD